MAAVVNRAETKRAGRAKERVYGILRPLLIGNAGGVDGFRDRETPRAGFS